MRKLIMIVLFCSVASVNALTTPNSDRQPALQQPSAGDQKPSEIDDSFLKVAEIGKKVQMVNKEIQAAQLQAQLNDLRKMQNMKDLGFSVYQILGFGKNLNVTLLTSSGSFLELTPGEMVNSQYRVNLVTPSTVKVMEVKTGKIYNVPLNKPVTTDAKGKAMPAAAAAKQFTAPQGLSGEAPAMMPNEMG